MKFKKDKIVIILGMLFFIAIIFYQYYLIKSADKDISYKNIEIEQLEISVRELKSNVSMLESSLTSCELKLTQCKKNLQINMNNNSMLQQEKQSLETKRFFGW